MTIPSIRNNNKPRSSKSSYHRFAVLFRIEDSRNKVTQGSIVNSLLEFIVGIATSHQIQFVTPQCRKQNDFLTT